MMTTKEPIKRDKEGYILLPREFTESGWRFNHVKDLSMGWCIYARTKANDKSYTKTHYELIRPRKQEEGMVCGRKLEKKWKYPSTNDFGKIGFDIISVDECERRLDGLLTDKEEVKARKTNRASADNIVLPKAKEFLLKDIVASNSETPVYLINKIVAELVASKRLRVVGSRKNKIGKASKVYSQR